VFGSLRRADHVVVGGAEVHRLVHPDAPGLSVSHSVDLLGQPLYMLLLW
jgi:hypothetical protein